MSADASFILQELHLYNWGAFAGRHQVAIDPGNSAIIGPTGSGKTTLVDALMTLLCASPRYNLASTGGHESDRDLVSYVRGASGQGNDSGDHIARAGRCATGLAARLVRGAESVWLGALLWFDGSSQSAADMQKRWLFAQGQEHNLDLWLEEQHSGGAKALTRLAKDSDGLQMFSSKAPYLAKLHSFFEVGPNAFTLLNRAAGLKQLNSIDEIFRELVLDDHAAFDDAQKVVDGFAELASIHADLELANAQYVSLLPLRDLATREQQQAQHQASLQALQQQLPHWFAAQGAQWWGQRVAQLQAQMAARGDALLAAQAQVHRARKHEQDLHGLYLQAGGASIESLQENIEHARKELARIAHNLAQYQALARNLGLGDQRQRPTTCPATRPKPRRRWSRSTQKRPSCRPRPNTPSPRPTTPTPACATPRPNTTPCASALAPTCPWSFSAFALSWPSTWACQKATCPLPPSWSKCAKPSRPGAAPSSVRWAATACAFWCPRPPCTPRCSG
jgi:uncharacterized protein YPO0396